MKYNKDKKRRRVPSRVWMLFLTIIVLAIGGTILAQTIYNRDLKPVSTNPKSQLFSVNEGSSVKQIAAKLKSSSLVRSSWAFELFVHTHEQASNLQAGTYALSPSEPLSKIVSILSQGKVATKLVTILPGKSVDQIKADLINDGFSPSSVDSALNPAQYSDLPVLAFKPTSVDSLEGLLWPDSFQKQSDTSPSTIIQESLSEMAEHLTPSVQAAFASEGLSTYQGLTLSSIVNQEVSKPSDAPQVAQVFLTRLKGGMPLQSDATARYGAVEAGQAPSLSYNSPYNTYLHTGLPPSPISTVSETALNAAAHPAATNWLYFVTGDDGTTYFSTTLAQHQQQTAQYCHKLCSSE
jgi:UPF0755 protein